ncbi:MAG: 2-oxoacid:acceptor oxidoreductase subunit alpha, partial [Elusimicrobia bacterium]|nr:2-oxoacid:acceptor oxidoreductase subunit alpha [Elusimicrobiota bacterium]
FYLTMEAFNLAEKYQCPVILLSDLLLAEHFETIDDLDFSKVKIDRGEMVTQSGDGGYKRYLCTPSGISPRAVPGTPGTIYVAGSDEHEEDGTLISDVFTDPVKRVAMMDKRMRKMQTALQNLPAPQLVGPENAELTVVGWGSTYSVIRDAARMLEKEGVQIAHLHIRYVWPFQSQAVSKILKSSKKTLIIENNFTGQMEKLIRQETGLTIQHHLRKYDGEPFGPTQVYQKIKEVLSAKKVPELVA